METLFWLAAIVAMISVLSTLATRLLTRKKRARWVWDHSSLLGYALMGLGTGLIVFAFVVDQSGAAMSSKLALGSLLLVAGLWLIW